MEIIDISIKVKAEDAFLFSALMNCLIRGDTSLPEIFTLEGKQKMNQIAQDILNQVARKPKVPKLSNSSIFEGNLGNTRYRGSSKIYRNCRCPCGSGKKFKQCCGVGKK